MNIMKAVFLCIAVTLYAMISLGADAIWDGGGSDDNLRTFGNWVGDIAPDTNDVLIFKGSLRTTPNNDFASGTQFNGIMFSNTVASQSFFLGGNAIDLGGDITSASSAGVIEDTISLPLQLVGAQRNINLDTNHNLTISGAISGLQQLRKYGPGVLTLTSANTHSGKTIFGENVAGEIGGTINIRHSDAFGSGSVEFENDGTIEIGVSGLTLPNSVNVPYRQGTLRTIQLDLPGSAIGTLAGNMDIRQGTANAYVMDVGVDDTLTLGGTLSTGAGGGAGITKEGAGTLVVSGDNTYLGNTTIREGVVKITHKNALGSTSQGTIVADGATLELNQGDGGSVEPITISGTGVGGQGVIYSTGANCDIGGLVTLATNATIGGTARIDHWGGVTDNGNGYTLTKIGNFDYVPSGSADFSHLVVDGGSYTMTGNNALPGSSGTVTINSGCQLTLWSGLSVANEPNITFNNSRYAASRNIPNVSSINGTMILNGAVDFQSWATEHTVFSDISGDCDLTIKSIVNTQDSAGYIFAGDNTYSGSTAIGTGSSGVGKMTLRAGSFTGLSSNSAHTVTVNSTLVLNGYDNTVGSLAGAGLVENAGFVGPLADDFSSGSVNATGVRFYESQIDGGWITRYDGEWQIADGVARNSATNTGGYPDACPAEATLVQMVSNSFDGDNLILRFDYNVASGDKLYAHFWGYTGVLVAADDFLGNTESCNGTYGNAEDRVELDAFNFKDGADSFSGHFSTSISGELTGSGSYTNVISIADLNIPGVDSLADFTFISLAFCKEESGLIGTTSVDNVRIMSSEFTTLTAGVDDSSTTFSGIMQDGEGGIPLAFTKDGGGVQTLSGPNTYSGPTTILDGTLFLGANNTLSDSTELVMAGGTLDAGSASDTIGALNLTGNSTLELGSGHLTFGDSTGLTWSGVLVLTGTLGDTSLRFVPNITAEQKSHILYNGSSVSITPDGYIVPLGGTVILVK